MARFFTIFNSNESQLVNMDRSLDAALNFFSSNIKDEQKTEYFDAFDGRLKGFVIFRKEERKRIHRDVKNKTIIVCDGSPMIENNSLDAKKFNDLYQRSNLSKLSSDIDGGHIELIIDENNSKISLVRDRIGLKPVYFYNSDNKFVCSSNAGAIIRSGLVVAKPNQKVIGKYAACNFRAPYGSENSFFKDINMLPSGTIINYHENKINFNKYWDWDSEQDYLKLKEAELLIHYRNTIKKSVSNFYSDTNGKNVAVALSGGVDSGTIIGMLHSITNNKVDAVSLSYDEKTNYDESELIQCSVRDHANNWSDLKLDPKILLKDLQSLYNKFDIPLATISIYGYEYLYREMARIGYKNIFTGAGGDYFQAGNYPCFYYYFADLKLSDQSKFESEVNHWIDNHGTSEFPKDFKTVDRFFDQFIDFNQTGKLKEQELFLSKNILDTEFYNSIGNVNSSIVKSYGSYQRTYIVQEFLYEAVAPGVEAEDLIDWRHGTSMISPFFSKSLINLGWQLPPEQKIENGVNKILSRKALKGICAEEILNRVQKSGFNAPFDIWLRGPLKEFAMDIFNSKSFKDRKIYDINKFNHLLNKHMDGSQNNMMLLWQALNLELWQLSWIGKN